MLGVFDDCPLLSGFGCDLILGERRFGAGSTGGRQPHSTLLLQQLSDLVDRRCLDRIQSHRRPSARQIDPSVEIGSAWGGPRGSRGCCCSHLRRSGNGSSSKLCSFEFGCFLIAAGCGEHCWLHRERSGLSIEANPTRASRTIWHEGARGWPRWRLLLGSSEEVEGGGGSSSSSNSRWSNPWRGRGRILPVTEPTSAVELLKSSHGRRSRAFVTTALMLLLLLLRG